MQVMCAIIQPFSNSFCIFCIRSCNKPFYLNRTAWTHKPLVTNVKSYPKRSNSGRCLHSFVGQRCMDCARKLIFGYVGALGTLLASLEYQLLKFAFWSFFGQSGISTSCIWWLTIGKIHAWNMFAFSSQKTKMQIWEADILGTPKGSLGPQHIRKSAI